MQEFLWRIKLDSGGEQRRLDIKFAHTILRPQRHCILERSEFHVGIERAQALFKATDDAENQQVLLVTTVLASKVCCVEFQLSSSA